MAGGCANNKSWNPKFKPGTRRGPLHTFEVAVLWTQQVRVHLEIKELSGGMPGRAALATTFNVHVVSPRIGDPVFGVSAAAGANRPDL